MRIQWDEPVVACTTGGHGKQEIMPPHKRHPKSRSCSGTLSQRSRNPGPRPPAGKVKPIPPCVRCPTNRQSEPGPGNPAAPHSSPCIRQQPALGCCSVSHQSAAAAIQMQTPPLCCRHHSAPVVKCANCRCCKRRCASIAQVVSEHKLLWYPFVRQVPGVRAQGDRCASRTPRSCINGGVG